MAKAAAAMSGSNIGVLVRAQRVVVNQGKYASSAQNAMGRDPFAELGSVSPPLGTAALDPPNRGLAAS